MVIMVMGLPGSGKSYFAAGLASLLGAVYIGSDGIRKEILKAPRYTDAEKSMIYDELLCRAELSAAEGGDVVLDATFHLAAIRARFIASLQALGETVCIEIVADEELIRERLKRPRKDSDANFEIYREIRQVWEPVQDEHLVLRSTDSNLEYMLDEATAYLQHC